MENRKIVYEISGRTKANKFCSTGLCSSKEIAIQLWKSEYPRFKGKAILAKQNAELSNYGVYFCNPAAWQEILQFHDNKALSLDLCQNT